MYKRLGGTTLAILGVLCLLAAWAAPQIGFRYDFEKFFPSNHPDLTYYNEFRGWFENDNDYLLIGLQHKVFDSAFLNQVEVLAAKLDTVQHVQQVVSPTRLKRFVYGPLGPVPLPLLRIDQPASYAADSARIMAQPQYKNVLINEQGTALALLVGHAPGLSKLQADTLLGHIYGALTPFDPANTHLTGKLHAQHVYVDKMQVELLTFLSASICLVVIFLAFTYRAWWGVIVPIIVVMVAVLFLVAIMVGLGKDLDLMMTLMPTIMFVVGMSDIVHILTRYIEELRLGRNKIKALRIAFKEVGLATFLTSLTTSIGFLTLLTASISPIRYFGLYTAIGVFVAFIVAFTLLPSILLFLKKPKVAGLATNKRRWQKVLRVALLGVLYKHKAVLAISGVLVALALLGISRLKVDAHLLDDISSGDKLKQDYAFFDKAFAGSNPFEMTVRTTDSGHTVWDRAVLQEIDQVEQYLSNTYGVQNLSTPATVVRVLMQALNGGQLAYYRLPQTEKEWRRVEQRLPRFLERASSGLAVTALNDQVGRISGKTADLGTRKTLAQNTAFDAWAQQNTNAKLTQYRITGTSVLIARNNEMLTGNMLEGLGIAFGVIALIAGLMFRSWRMVFISLVPNVVPLLMVAGIMGFFNIDLQLSTSIIFTIAFGIAVDDTIHFTSKLRMELAKGRSLLYAIKRTYLSTGKAIIITSMILMAGFLTPLLSTFGGTYYTGLMITLTLFFAMVIDLTLLPVLIMLFYKPAIKK